MYIDTHAHVNFNAYKEDADEIIRHSLNEGVWMLLASSNYKTSKRALEFANKYEKGVYAAVGLHPIHLFDVEAKDENNEYNFKSLAEEFNYENFDKLAKFEKVVAIGEIGLEYHHISLLENVNVIKEKQKKVFIDQLVLAKNLKLPVIIHCREAHDDMLSILSDFKNEYKNFLPTNKPWGVMHCFSGDEDLAWKYFSLGLYISFTGMITFSKRWDDLIRKMPIDKLLIETDCPYMTPEPYRGQRNEPVLVKLVADRIAEIRNLTMERVGEVTFENAKRLFGF